MSEYSKTSQLSMTFSFSQPLVDDITLPSSLSQELVDSQDSGYAVLLTTPSCPSPLPTQEDPIPALLPGQTLPRPSKAEASAGLVADRS